MSISTALAMACVLVVSGPAFAQSPAQSPNATEPDRTRIVAGALVENLDRSWSGHIGPHAAFGGWVDIKLEGWELGTITFDVSRSRPLQGRGEWCPFADCSLYYERNASGEVVLVNPTHVPAPGLERVQNWIASVAALKQFGPPDPARPHFLFGAAVVSEEESFVFDNAALGRQRRTDVGLGPTAGIGIDFLAERFVIRAQYRFTLIFAGINREFPATQQLRIGAGWTF